MELVWIIALYVCPRMYYTFARFYLLQIRLLVLHQYLLHLKTFHLNRHCEPSRHDGFDRIIISYELNNGTVKEAIKTQRIHLNRPNASMPWINPTLEN